MNKHLENLFTGLLMLAMTVIVIDGGIRMFKIKNPVVAVFQFFIMFVAYLVIAIWLGRLLSRWVGEKSSHLFWPATTVVPPPLYYLIEFYVERGHWERVLFEYEKILKYHPYELRAHLGRLETMAILKRAPSEIEKVYRKSFKELASNEALLLLNETYEKIFQRDQPVEGLFNGVSP